VERTTDHCKILPSTGPTGVRTFGSEASSGAARTWAGNLSAGHAGSSAWVEGFCHLEPGAVHPSEIIDDLKTRDKSLFIIVNNYIRKT